MVQADESYDLKALVPGVAQVTSKLSESDRYDGRLSYHFSTCEPMNPQAHSGMPVACLSAQADQWSSVLVSGSPGSRGNPVVASALPMYVCVLNRPNRLGAPQQVANGGAIPSYLPLDPDRSKANATQKGTSSKKGLHELGTTIAFNHGATVVCSAADGTTGVDPQTMTTKVHFVCDASAGIGAAVDVSPTGTINTVTAPPCQVELEWRSAQACPMCTEKDYGFYDDACQPDRTAVRSFFWKEPRTCVGGEKLPDPTTTEGCDPVETVDDKQVAVNKSTIVGGVVAAVLSVLAVAAFVGFVCWKRNKLYEENMRLRSYAQLGEGSAIPDVVQLQDR